MKLDEDLGRRDHEETFFTDDEENQSVVALHSDDDTDSDGCAPPSRRLSSYMDAAWPQSFRQSVDMLTSVTPPMVSLGTGGFLSTSFKRAANRHSDSAPLIKPLIPNAKPIKQEEPTLVQQPYSGCPKFSYSEFPQPRKHCSFAQSVFNEKSYWFWVFHEGINILCGVGLLSIPYAVKEGGWLSLIELITLCVMCCYTGILMRRCLESSPGLETYPDIGYAAFGSAGRLGIAIILYMELYGSCVEYIILMSNSLSLVFPNIQIRLAGIDLDTHQTLAIIAVLPVLPTLWLRNLSLLSYLSVGGIVASILVITCLFWVGVVDQVGFHTGGKALDLANLPVTIGLYGFCFAGHSVFPNIYSSMKEPSKFPEVLLICFGICLVVYTGVAAAGYSIFGDPIKTQFTLNMPQGLYASKIAVWTMIVNPLTKFAFTLLPVAMSMEELLPSHLRNYAASLVVRTLLALSCLVVALTFPYFGAVNGFIGSALAMTVALVLPCVNYLKLYSGRLSKMQVASCILIIITGIVCAVLGSYSSLTKLANDG